jgi:RimJ/RimL family protein N-acetyltransferase
MLSTAEANENTKFFTHHWTITIPAHPSLKYIHTTVTHLDEWLVLVSDPANNPYDETARTQIWDMTAIEEWKISTTQKYIDSQSKFNALNMLIQFNGQLVGGGNFFLLPTGEVNLGLMLTKDARGKGIGKLSMQVLIQLAHNMGIERLEAGTMKANQPMRALMASLKIPGRDEIKKAPGRGVLAEILYTIPKTVDWEDIDLHVEFGAPVSE